MTTRGFTDVGIKALDKAGRHQDGAQAGLYMVLTPRNAGGFSRSWVFKFMLNRKSYEMGLGPYPEVSLKSARKKAGIARSMVKDEQRNPLEERRAQQAAALADEARQITFQEAATRCIAARSSGWKNPKHAAQWPSTLQTYAYPKIGKLKVAKVDVPDVLRVLEPIWLSKHETASRLRQRIEIVLDWAKAGKFRSGDNPASIKGLVHLLPSVSADARRNRPQPSMPFAALPDFMAKLRAMPYVSAKALEFLTLTACRTGEVIGAKWKEIDFDKALWTIPAERMKAGREHEVPLSERALEVLDLLPREKGNPHLFIGRSSRPLSNMAMLELMKEHAPIPRQTEEGDGEAADADPKYYVPHGMRATFRTWVGEKTNHLREVAEHALAHRLPDAVEAAYSRGTMLEKRRHLMEDWSRYCTPTPANVVSIRAKS